MDVDDAPVLSKLELLLLYGDERLIAHLFSFVQVHEIMKVMQTSKTMEAMCRVYKRIGWNIGSRLRPWFVDVDGFRAKLHRCNAIISGSQALQFFDRNSYPGSDMDIYVRSGSAEELGRWLLRDGYKYRSRSRLYSHSRFRRDAAKLAVRCIERGSGDFKSMGSVDSKSMLSVFNFARKGSNNQLFKIQVIVVDVDPVRFILHCFHSSGSSL